MYDPGAPKPSVFTRVGRLRVLPHTKEQKPSPNGLQEYVFMEVLAGSRFEVFEVHPSIHPSIHTQFLWGLPETHGFLCMLNRFCMVFTVVLETYKLILLVFESLHRNVLWRFEPKGTIKNIKIDKHTYILFDVTITFWRFVDDFLRFDGIYHGFWGWGFPKTRRFEMYVSFCMYDLHVFYRRNTVLHTN